MKFIIITPWGTEQIEAENMSDAFDYVYGNFTGLSNYEYITIAKVTE